MSVLAGVSWQNWRHSAFIEPRVVQGDLAGLALQHPVLRHPPDQRGGLRRQPSGFTEEEPRWMWMSARSAQHTAVDDKLSRSSLYVLEDNAREAPTKPAVAAAVRDL